MFIQSINSYNNQRYTPVSHKSWTRTVHKENGSRFVNEVLHRNDTFLFREEELWEFLRNYIVAKYNSVKKVNVYNYGCSNGSEACTFLMTMFGNHDAEVAKKFTPIIAKDYDPYAIEKAKTHLLPVVPFERYLINAYTDDKFDKFLEKANKQDESGKELYKIKPQYSSKIKYSVADIRQDYKMIRPDNSIIFARNFWALPISLTRPMVTAITSSCSSALSRPYPLTTSS
jgi:chemotaxis methyl-accepting protein methylase